MRKITRRIVTSFINGKPDTLDNTSTDGTTLFLHGNPIAQKNPSGAIVATLAGWPTVTTRERLNGLCRLLGKNCMFHQSKHVQYFQDKPISPTEWVVISD